MHDFDPGYAQEPYATLVRSCPGPELYPAAEFRTEWGPVFHRGRLDGSARVLVIGQAAGQPSWFMQNFTADHPVAHGIRATGEIVTATGDGRVGFIDAEDIAAVAARALLDDRPHTEHLITGPEALGYADVARIVTEVLGRPVRLSPSTPRRPAHGWPRPAFRRSSPRCSPGPTRTSGTARRTVRPTPSSASRAALPAPSAPSPRPTAPTGPRGPIRPNGTARPGGQGARWPLPGRRAGCGCR